MKLLTIFVSLTLVVMIILSAMALDARISTIEAINRYQQRTITVILDILEHRREPPASIALSQWYASSHRVPPRYLFKLIEVESTWRTDAVSSVGARGLMQIKPIVLAHHHPEADPDWLFDPRFNVHVGLEHLDWLLDQNGGDLEQAVNEYRWGRRGAARGDGTGEYVRRVFE